MFSNLSTVYLSFSSHNWNSLFVGTNAVADAIAEKYNTTKSQVLDHVSSLLSERPGPQQVQLSELQV